MLSTLLMGAYTIIYFGTLYAYTTKKAAQRWGVVTTITILYLLCLAQLAIQWYALQWEFIVNGETRQDIYLSILENPEALVLASFVTSYSVIIVADGLLIWRCFHVWNRSLRVIAFPLFLFIAETGMIFAAIIINGINGSLILTQRAAMIMNNLLAAGFFVSFGTSLMATLLIAYRIWTVYQADGKSLRRFKNILDIIIQSAAINSIALLLTAITLVIPDSGNIFNAPLFALGNYAKAFFVAISGLAPTIMVARIAFGEPDNTYVPTAPRISGLQFGGARTTHDSVLNNISTPEFGEKTQNREF
ncbi:hypothetical protein CVT25_002478 [Psilocybe cyanescens]|uniref:Uncharacterized protein n=1 Tax=Psilocybe cyanescens TaxID=93625 RepID=A0A409X4Q1_PSICY|nr:hypothetical protein CVT25_002478 [Psilocybe cyanescens]